MQTDNKILLVENDDAVRMALEAEMKQLGHKPVATWSGIDALGLLESGRFDVLLVDDHLPDMYIGDFLERVSQLPVQPKIWLMQTGPAQDTRVYGSRCYPVVGKRDLAQIFQRAGAGMNGDVAGWSGWKH